MPRSKHVHTGYGKWEMGTCHSVIYHQHLSNDNGAKQHNAMAFIYLYPQGFWLAFIQATCIILISSLLHEI